MDPTLNKTQDGLYDGRQAPGVPRFRAVGTAEYEVPWIAPGLSLYGSVSRTDGWWLDAGNTRRVPGFTLGDLGAIYRAKLAAKPTTWRLSIENVADTRYWSGTSQGGGNLNIGTPRTVLASMSLDF